MAEANRGNRPLSPFMIGPYYRPQLTSITSILTRITGLSMLAAAALLAWWLVAAGASAQAFDRADGILTSFPGDVVMSLSVLGLWYHTLAGMRHLLWDTGRGLEIRTAERLGIACLVGSVVLTVLTLIVV